MPGGNEGGSREEGKEGLRGKFTVNKGGDRGARRYLGQPKGGGTCTKEFFLMGEGTEWKVWNLQEEGRGGILSPAKGGRESLGRLGLKT